MARRQQQNNKNESREGLLPKDNLTELSDEREKTKKIKRNTSDPDLVEQDTPGHSREKNV